MDYFEAVARRRYTNDREAEGLVADNMKVRIGIVERIKSGEITLAQGQAELRRIKRTAKDNGQITRAQAWGGK